MPGRYALKLCPDLAKTLAENMHILVITGTNGKTTSARISEQVFADAGLDYLTNRSGANLLSGITTELALRSSVTGKCRKSYAVIECDEAAARKALGQLQPEVVLVTNLFRDQLDRYGEVMHTLENIREGLKNVPKAVLCLNADCSLTSSLALDLPNQAVYYGIEHSASDWNTKPPALSDAAHCIRCKTQYEYDYVTYGHLGGFRCPKCGYTRPATDVAVTAIQKMDASSSTVEISARGEQRTIRVNLPALYNIYNAAGVLAAVKQFGFGLEQAAGAVEHFQCGFGRMEQFRLGKAGARVMLVKNPAGCDQVLRFLAALDGEMELAVLLNDHDADGKDVSWIWDAEFEALISLGKRLRHVTVSGSRAWDLFLRLKYAGIAPELLSVERSYTALTEQLATSEVPIFIMPTYTALLEFRPHLIRKCGGSDFWEG